LRSRSVIEWWSDLPLPALLFNRYLGINPPEITLALLVTFHESIVLTQVVTYTRLPTASRSLELVPGILLLDIGID
jgi:hypothetical protein